MDPYVEKVRKKYEELKNTYRELPEFEDFVKAFGIPLEEEVKDLPGLFKAVRGSLNSLQEAVLEILSPGDFIAAHNGKFVYNMREELLELIKCIQICKRRLTLALFEAERSLNLRPVAKAIKESCETLQKKIEVWRKAQEKMLDGWENIKNWEEEVNYRW